MPPKRARSHSQRDQTAPPAPALNLASALGDSADLDPSLLALASTSGTTATTTTPPIDPTLFTIEQVVNDVRRGHVKPEDLDDPEGGGEQPPLPVEEDRHVNEQHHHDPIQPVLDHAEDVHAQVPVDGEHSHIQLDDDGIDPALREIVNSLTNAQQSHSGFSENPDERERLDRERLQHTLQTTLEDFAQNGFGSYSAIFNTNFPEAGSSRFMISPPPEPPAETPPVKRGRGRPKGSKNKPKPNAPSPPPPPAKRPRGRPPKVRTTEEVQEIERRKQEKELGINRKRGRPRKYPDIGLVRDLRLKKNRGYFAEKMAEREERESNEGRGSSEFREGSAAFKDGVESSATDSESNVAAAAAAAALVASEVTLGQQVAAAVARDAEESDHYSWQYQDGQSLLDAVGMGTGIDVDQRDMGVELPDAPSVGAMGQSDDGMRGVFNLADVSGPQ